MTKFFLLIAFVFIGAKGFTQKTEVQYLSGHGSDDMVQWDFMCSGGMNANKWAKIGVPSCWELQGFGKYDYGFAKDSVRGKESGFYKYNFRVPANWKSKTVNIVFEGVMTDALVKINGKPAGAMHQGAFYMFKYDITKLLKYGRENLLEVRVDKHSSNKSVNAAEREADYWIFGGIFRPVWLEALPQQHISHIAIDAKADGSFIAKAATSKGVDKIAVQIFDKNKQQVAEESFAEGELSKTKVSHPSLWSSESPTLYTAVFSAFKNGKKIHELTQKFGFRTVEVRQRDGIYINGVKMKFKGVNRHSFRPETGRTTSKRISIEDVLLMKEMNMNAVRMSHYPPDNHFLDACDSLGLYVMDELAGWHGHYDTPTGAQLVREMVLHDENHPSIFIWSNGNEGGHNFDLDSLFTQFDIQKRSVVHPWQLFNGIETQHYRQYNYGIGNYDNGKDIVLPTEFLHGQFDGGHGAGLEDYWKVMWQEPLHAGGFLWDFADQGVVRKDLNDSLDTDKHRGADGIVGPHHEKEAAFFAIKGIWSPVFFERREITSQFNGTFNIENRYQFTNLNQCSFSWVLRKYTMNKLIEKKGVIPSPSIAPGDKGVLKIELPAGWVDYNVLYVTAKGREGEELFTWSFPIKRPVETTREIVDTVSNNKIEFSLKDSLYIITIKDVQMQISNKSGVLKQVKNAKGLLPFSNGPVIQEGITNFKNFSHHFDGENLVITSSFDKKESFNTLCWTVYPTGWVKMEIHYFPASLHTNYLGVNFNFPEKQMRAVTYMGDGPYRVWKNRLKGNQFGVWTKEYNNTETGEYPWVYPEFKGYYSNFYGGYFNSANNRFAVAAEIEGLFLRLFTPAWKTDPWHNYEPIFPSGDISFMNAIPSIGNKTQTAETTGPMGLKNSFYDYEKDPSRAVKMVLWFNFN
ncbi:MAG: glycoside hydrolase family 2 TIM barrel-domain containing protein [Niabella sp.]